VAAVEGVRGREPARRAEAVRFVGGERREERVQEGEQRLVEQVRASGELEAVGGEEGVKERGEVEVDGTGGGGGEGGGGGGEEGGEGCEGGFDGVLG